MKKTQLSKLLSAIVCIVLIAAMALCMTACNDNSTNDPVSSGVTGTTQQEVTKVGEGATVFEFTVVDADGKLTNFEVYTDKTTVGEALLDEGLIAGDEGDYGLYVKTVNGITLDYEKDGKYWAFYVNDKYAMSGVGTTDIVAGDSYAFKAEK